MRYAESEKLASEVVALRGLIAKCDEQLAKVDDRAVLLVAQWAALLGEDEHRVNSVLSGLAKQGLLIAKPSFECQCGFVAPSREGSCSSCGESLRGAKPCSTYVFSESAIQARKEARAAESASNAPVPTLVEPPSARIGIIAALPYELAAVQLMLDSPREWHAESRGKMQKYIVGTIPALSGGVHEVVVSLLPDVGTDQAAARAEKMLQQVPTVQNIIMCGIAGGMPRPGVVDDDVRLGDIVYSNRGGVIQYDFGKDDNGKWEPRHRPRPPSAELLEACRHLEAGAELGKRPWETYLARAPGMKDATRPGDNEDAKGNAIEYPPDARRVAGMPRVFEGPIASSNVLLKNAARRDELRAQYGVKAAEMEGIGIADATWAEASGYLVVRGIVDYCDPAKGDRWHRYGAVAAAAYTRALIETLGVPSQR